MNLLYKDFNKWNKNSYESNAKNQNKTKKKHRNKSWSGKINALAGLVEAVESKPEIVLLKAIMFSVLRIWKLIINTT